MKIVCVGGGPAGLYFAISAKLRDPGHQVTVVERDPAGVTYGWGVTFSDTLLDTLYTNDPESARRINEQPVSWNNQEVYVRGGPPAHLGGYGYAVGRKVLLDILAERASQLGVDVQFEHEVEDLSEFAHADLLIASDGANSRVRRRHADHFQTHADEGRNKYIWLGTHRVFDSFLFAFEQTAAGWIWCYAYRFNADTTTFIVECSPQTWTGLGFDVLGPDESLALLEHIFQRHLAGHRLINPMSDLGRTPWLNFVRITNKAWYHRNIVLLGDAAHTTHFSIGSGTTLAMQDAAALAEKLHEYQDVPVALHAYQEERRAAVLMAQSAALKSTEWFENVPRYIAAEPTQFAYDLWRRRGHYPPWRYQLHLATQIAAVRRLRCTLSTARRELRARRRSKLAQAQQRSTAAINPA
ncbi:MAG TPA: FAD-dependent monooxygenase [Pseudonocardiaceae bacterium]|jgi:anthraniloyl-CoA monooxygenase|nr:FAD-dependent monooxygenase [Pseudonocardiaceae bacterium]